MKRLAESALNQSITSDFAQAASDQSNEVLSQVAFEGKRLSSKEQDEVYL
jgi:hypothetical protein